MQGLVYENEGVEGVDDLRRIYSAMYIKSRVSNGEYEAGKP